MYDLRRDPPAGADGPGPCRAAPRRAQEDPRAARRRRRHLGPRARRVLARRCASTTRGSRSPPSAATWRSAGTTARTRGYVLISAGGYHPEFPVPPAFPKLEQAEDQPRRHRPREAVAHRLPRIHAEHQAVRRRGSTSSVQGGGVSFEATISFDALFTEDVGCVVDFDVEIKIKFKGTTFCGDRRLRPPQRLGAQARRRRVVDRPLADLDRLVVREDLRQRSCCRPRSEPVDPLPPLVAALTDPLQLDRQPAATPSARSSRSASGPAAATCSCIRSGHSRSARRSCRWASVSNASAARRCRPRSASTSRTLPSGASRSPPREPSTTLFAAGDFLELSDDEQLARPSFEAMHAGVAVQPAGFASGDPVASEMDFDDVIVGAGGASVRPATKGTITGAAAALAAAFGPAARSPLRSTGAAPLRGRGARRRAAAPDATSSPASTTSRRPRATPAAVVHRRRAGARAPRRTRAAATSRWSRRSTRRRPRERALPVPPVGARGRRATPTGTPTRSSWCSRCPAAAARRCPSR